MINRPPYGALLFLVPHCHCEEAGGRRSNLPDTEGDCFASLAVTKRYFPLSFSSSSTIPETTSKPPCQKAASRMLMPARVRISSGEREPPADSNSRQRGLNP